MRMAKKLVTPDFHELLSPISLIIFQFQINRHMTKILQLTQTLGKSLGSSSSGCICERSCK